MSAAEHPPEKAAPGKSRPDAEMARPAPLSFLETVAPAGAGPEVRLLRTALEAAANGIVITDRDGYIVWANPAFARLTGYALEEVLGENPRLLKSGRHDEAFYRQMWETILAGRVWHGEVVNRRKDGSLYTEEMTITPVRDEQGEVRHFIAIKQDITARRQAEEELRAQKGLLEDLVTVARATARRPSLEETLRNVLQVAVDLTRAERGSLFLLDPEGRVERGVLAREMPPAQQEEVARLVMEKGLAGLVARQRQPLCLEDATQDARWLSLAEAPYTARSAMAIPILQGERVLGVLTLTDPSPGRFGEREVHLLEAAAAQMALALHNAQLYEEQRQQAQLQGTLYQVLRAVGGHLDLPTIAQTAVEMIASRAGWPAVALLLPDPEDAGHLLVQASAGEPPIVPGRRVPSGGGIVGRAFRSGHTRYSADLSQEPHAPLPAGAALAVPLRRGEQALGVLLIAAPTPHPLDRKAALLAEPLAEAIALALDNARLYETARRELDLRRRSERLETVNRIARAVGAVLDMGGLLDTIHRQIEERFHPDLFFLALYNPTGKSLQGRMLVQDGVPLPAPSLPLTEGVAALLTGRQTRLVPDGAAEAALPPLLFFAGASDYRSRLEAPICLGERPLGLLALYTRRPHAYDEEDALLLAIVTDQVAAALENARLYQQVQEQREQLRALSAHLAEVQESERQRLARELHDQVGQNLTALGLNLNLVRSLLPSAEEAVQGRLADSLSLVEQTTERIRNVMAELRPPVLDDYGLMAALRWYGEQFAFRSGIQVTVAGEEPNPRLPLAVEGALFRIAQEALNNVAKHARAGRVTVSLETTAEAVRMQVRDNGIGFARRGRPGGWGLLSMQERAEAVGGTCRVESLPHRGTTVTVEVPR